MDAITFETKDDKFLISVDRQSFKEEFVMQLVSQLHMQYLTDKVAFGEDIENVGEDIKATWWDNNKSKLLGTPQ